MGKDYSINQLCLGIIASGIGFMLRPADVFLCESVVLTQRQQQMFFVRKRSANAAAATDVFCAKA